MSLVQILGENYSKNGTSAEVSGFVPDMSADIYYEVLRLIDGKLLFLHDHLERLEYSLAGSGILFPGKEVILENLRLLLQNNSLSQGNIRICLQAVAGKSPNLLCYFVPYYYPTGSMYQTGVDLLTYPHERPQPGIKKWDDSFRKSVGKYIRAEGVYEAVLLNQKNQITEGSRSNLFFIDPKGKLITAPKHMILPGITRKYVLEIAGELRIPVKEKLIPLVSLSHYPSAFISGTSPKVLPVKRLDNFIFDVSHPVLLNLRDRFEQIIQENLTGI